MSEGRCKRADTDHYFGREYIGFSYCMLPGGHEGECEETEPRTPGQARVERFLASVDSRLSRIEEALCVTNSEPSTVVEEVECE